MMILSKWADSRYLHRGTSAGILQKTETKKILLQGMIFQTIRRLTKIRKENAIFHSDAICMPWIPETTGFWES